MTGRTPLQTGVWDPFNPWYKNGLPVDEKLLPEYLRDAGYRTVAIGKWHLGPNLPQYHPMKRGFDSFYGSLNGYLNHDTQTVFGRRDWQRDGKTVDDEGYATHLIANEAIRVIEDQDAGEPLFLYVSFTAPHTPLQAPQAIIDTYADIQDPDRRTYAAMVSEMDAAIGVIMEAIHDSGQADNTLTVFFSDNGGNPRLGASNGPLRGGKGSPYEGGIRVPGLINWPGIIEAGSISDDRVVITDLLPTLLSAAGENPDTPKPVVGRDLWPALSRGDSIPAAPTILANKSLNGSFQYAYFEDNYKLVSIASPDGTSNNALFDVIADPSEEHDLAATHPDVVKSMFAMLDAMEKREPVTLGERTPDRGRGGPPALQPDDRPAIGTPFAESGPIPYPEGNYPETEE
jgi:arylsulfatase A-like enzyme